MYRLITKILFVAGLFILVPQIAQAGFLDDANLSCIKNGDCHLGHIAFGLSLLIKYLLGMMGAVALLYFVWGGLQWLTSGGSAERVNRGKQIMLNTFWAITIAFSSYLLVGFFVNDVLNVKDGSNNSIDFRIQAGDFTPQNLNNNSEPDSETDSESCEEECGDYEECTGVISNSFWESYSNTCMDICKYQGMILSDYTRIGRCVPYVLVGWSITPGVQCAESSHTCIYHP